MRAGWFALGAHLVERCPYGLHAWCFVWGGAYSGGVLSLLQVLEDAEAAYIVSGCRFPGGVGYASLWFAFELTSELLSRLRDAQCHAEEMAVLILSDGFADSMGELLFNAPHVFGADWSQLGAVCALTNIQDAELVELYCSDDAVLSTLGVV